MLVARRSRASAAANPAAVAAGCADHRAGAQHRAVSRPRAADHARPAEVGRRGAAGGARAAPGRHPAAARRRGRRSDRRSTCTAWARSPISCATSPRRTARITSSARASSGSRSSNISSGWPFLVARVLQIPEPDTRDVRDRGALRQSARRRRSRRSQLLPQAPPELLAAIQSIEAPAALADLAAAYMDVKPDEKQEILETVDITARHGQGLAHAGAPHRGAAAVAGDRPSRPRRRSTSASARCCCASRWRRSSGSSARATRARPPRSPSSKRRSPRPACRRRSRTRRARNCAGCSACPKPPANTAWCAPISTG